jgi:hypothetical protein
MTAGPRPFDLKVAYNARRLRFISTFVTTDRDLDLTVGEHQEWQFIRRFPCQYWQLLLIPHNLGPRASVN